MNRDTIDDHLAAGTITELQAQILHLRRRGFSQRQIALGLLKSRSAVRDLERAALLNIAKRKDAA